ncbi:Signal transduction histidine kinase [Sporobacter termitidis DSM 10068]|uniref:Stage 0 sporulation protein A homolog n=1 Tax=Sporobacter termitidis DSM 10068 TaxID=1123282 RepID=A0A1M5U6U2_9FIRM|nr:Signal transduction histidine kinase [Sporobacter termitidis DSM 10068]
MTAEKKTGHDGPLHEIPSRDGRGVELIQKQLLSHSKFQNYILNLSNSFIRSDFTRIDNVITDSLNHLCEFYSYDHSSIWAYDDAQETITCVYSCKSHAESLMNNEWRVLQYDRVADLFDFKNFERPYFLKLEDYKTSDISFGRILRDSGVKALYMFPLINEGAAIGGVVLATRKEYEELDENIYTAGQLYCTLISNVLIRKRQETAFKEAEALAREARILKEKEYEYLQMIDGSTVASWICDYEQGSLKYSAAWRKRIGGENIPDDKFMAFIEGLIQPDDLKRTQLERNLIFTLGQEKFRHEYRIKMEDDYIWVLDQGKIMYNEDGMPKKVYGTTMDINETKKAIRELEEIKDDLAAEVRALNTMHRLHSRFIIHDNIDDVCHEILNAAIFLSDAQKGCIHILEEDQETLIMVYEQGFDNDFVREHGTTKIGETIYTELPRENKRLVAEDIDAHDSIAQNPIYAFLKKWSVESLQATPLYSSTGHFVGVLSTHYTSRKQLNDREKRIFDMLARMAADVIEKVRTERALFESEQNALKLVDKLKKADKNKNQFIGILSHELRNPLATIVTGLSLFKLSPDGALLQSTCEILDRQVRQLTRLVDDLLDLTRFNNNKIRLKKESFSLNALLRGTAEDLAPAFDNKNIGLRTDLDCAGDIFADPVRIKQITENLLFNALRYTNEGGTCTLSAQRHRDEVSIRVKDSGIGICPEIISVIFEPFVQADSSMARPEGGLGLGLAIVKNIAELHGGSVSAHSEGPGRGAEFTIRLPLAAGVAAGDKPPETPLQDSRRNILFIDDNRDFAEIICALMTEWGYAAAYATDGRDGVRQAAETHPDVIFCDIGLPWMNGYDVAKKIRRASDLQRPVLIALTGYVSDRDREMALEAGFDYHMAKPLDAEMLRALLSRLE